MTDENLRSVKDYITELGDELVYEQETIWPEDMFFIFDLLETYYESHQERNINEPEVCDISWELAVQLKNMVADDPEVTWLNAFFVIDSLYQATRRIPTLDDSESDSTSEEQNARDEITHPSQFQYDLTDLNIELPASRTDEEFENTFEEIVELLELYIETEKLEENSISKESDGVPPLFEIEIFFSSLKKRYAQSFVDDILESTLSFKLSRFLITLEKDEDIQKTDIESACSKVRGWAGFRARREYERMVLGDEN